MMISMIMMIMIRWAVRLLACHPLVQERLQAELDLVTMMMMRMMIDDNR